jgi:dihydroorotase
VTPVRFDWLIAGGRVLDPANGIDRTADLALAGGRVAALADRIDPVDAAQVYDAAGQIVMPGLVDLHVHAYHLVTPLGIDVDHYCLGRGVTTAVDAGSAGCSTFAGFRGYLASRSRTRLLAFLNISCSGLAFAGLGGDETSPGELDLLSMAAVRGCIDCIEANRDLIVGLKVRLSDSCTAGGANENEAYRRAREAAASARVPLMVHHSFSTVSLEECPGYLRAGDLYTHMYHGFPSTIIDLDSRAVHAAVRDARARGVLFDVGHGQGSFNWTVAELCAAAGFWPDTISTDLHSGTCEGPAYDLPTVMTRMLRLGLPLYEVVRRTTVMPATAIAWDDRIGSLGLDREADVAVFALEPVRVELEDCQSQMRSIDVRVVPRAVWRSGERVPVTEPRCWPNPATVAAQRRWWPRLVVRDSS